MGHYLGMLPKILYSGSLELEPQYPALTSIPLYQNNAFTALAPSGKRVSYTLRTEETRKTSLVMDPREVQRWNAFATDWGLEGKQFEMMVDRNLGCYITGQNTYGDVANQNSVVPNETSNISYSSSATQPGIEMGSGTALGIANPWSIAGAVGSGTGGIAAITFIPRSMRSDCTSYYYFFTIGVSGVYLSRLLLYKSLPANEVLVGAYTDVGSWRARHVPASWTNNVDIVSFVAQWTAAGSIDLWVVKSGVVLQGSVDGYESSPGAGGFSLPFSGDVRVGFPDGIHTMKVLKFISFKETLTNPTEILSYNFLGRNYYNKAELVGETWTPQRLNPLGDLWSIEMTVRQGV